MWPISAALDRASAGCTVSICLFKRGKNNSLITTSWLTKPVCTLTLLLCYPETSDTRPCSLNIVKNSPSELARGSVSALKQQWMVASTLSYCLLLHALLFASPPTFFTDRANYGGSEKEGKGMLKDASAKMKHLGFGFFGQMSACFDLKSYCRKLALYIILCHVA